MPEPKPIPIDYQRPIPKQRRRPVTSIGLTLYLAFVVVIILMFGWFVLPRIKAVLADFKTALPPVTAILIGLLELMTRGPGIVVLLAIPVFIPMLVMRLTWVEDSPDATRRRFRLVRVAVTLIMAVLVICAAAAVLLPVSDLIENLSSPHK